MVTMDKNDANLEESQTTESLLTEQSEQPKLQDDKNPDEFPSTISTGEVSRGTWSGQLDFLMSMIAYAVGLGNVWRFPYLCFKHGGGTFLFVYAIFWFFGALPIFLLEVAVGQYLQQGGIEVWNIVPILKGVGFGNVVIACMCMWYYCVICTWALYYLIASVSWTFPWETCTNWWNTQSTSHMADWGGMQWELVGLNVFSWIIIYFALWKGITNARKVGEFEMLLMLIHLLFVYFCAISPYVLMGILVIRALTLEGAYHGLYYLFVPDISKMMTIGVWKAAGTQVFYSYGVGFGTLIALGSHNKYHQNFYRDSLILCFFNEATSMLASLIVFAILGYMSEVAGKRVEDIVKPGVGLAFLAYPEVAVRLPLKQIWAILFFVMLSILGIDSQVCMVEGAMTAVEDTHPVLRKYKKLFLLSVCVFFFVIGLPMLTFAGSHWLQLIDSYGPSGIALLFVVFFEVVGLSWCFGTDRVAKACKHMCDFRPGHFWIFLWKFAAPLSCLVLFILLIARHETLTYPGTEEPYPIWASIFGEILSLCSMVCIPGYAVYYVLCLSNGNGYMEKIRNGFKSAIPLPQMEPEEVK